MMKNTYFLLALTLLTTCLAAQTTLPPEMVFVEGGTFTMGCTPEQGTCYLDNYITRIVRGLPFYIGKYEVTWKQWQEIMNNNPSQCEQCPVQSMSLYSCITFCNRLSIQQGLEPAYYFDDNYSIQFDSMVDNSGVHLDVFYKIEASGYRLPIESEWELAARGGHLNGAQTLYSGSNNIDLVAHHSFAGMHPIGTKLPNNLGIYDMTGNVFEWCFDLWSVYARLPECILFLEHPVRGGCGFAGDNLSVSSRARSVLPGTAFNYFGFRLARNAD